MKTDSIPFFSTLILISVTVSAVLDLPNENDNFEDIRAQNKVYVDKSIYITKLLERKNRFLQLCRPPNFGKSNFLQMLSSFFGGKKEMFVGLKIHESHLDWQKYPVLYLDFAKMKIDSVEEFKDDLSRAITECGKTYGVDIPQTISVKSQLWQFLCEFSEKRGQLQSVVVLVNDYDRPLRRHMENENTNVAREMKRFLEDFLVIFRIRENEIKFSFFTCTTKVKLDILDKGSNLFEDISYVPEFNGMIGLTEEELTDTFRGHIDAMAVSQPNETFQSLVRMLRKRYDGYCFSQKMPSACRLYNFHSVISHLREKEAGTYWHSDGEQSLYNIFETFRNKERWSKYGFREDEFRDAVVTRADLEKAYNFNETLPMNVFLVLHGYLTFRSYDRLVDWFLLDFANEEMRETFKKIILERLPGGNLKPPQIKEKCDNIEAGMSEGNCQNFIEQINSVAFDPAESLNITDARNIPKYEHKLIDRVVRVFEACNMDASYKHEFHHLGGVVVGGVLELLVETSTESAYVFEFEMKKKASQAFTTLLNSVKRVAFQLEFVNRRMYLMGVHLSDKGGTIDEWIRVTYFNTNCTDLRASNPSFLKEFSKITKTPCGTIMPGADHI